MTFSPMGAAVSDQGTGPSQPEPESGTGNASHGEEPGQEHASHGGEPAPEPASYGTEPAAEQSGYGAEPGQGAAGQPDDQDATWPHQSYLELGSLPSATTCARLHTKLVLWEWDLGALGQTAALVVSELVTNAVQASAGIIGSRFAGQQAPGTPPVRMWLSADEYRLVIQVWDGSDQPPVPQPVEPEADSGRGLLLVGSLSAEWGCYAPEDSSGKVVWAVVAG